MIVMPDANMATTIQTLHDGLFWNEGNQRVSSFSCLDAAER
jgi:hypothetical protein